MSGVERRLCCRDGHGYPCVDQGPSLGGFAGGNPSDLFSSAGDYEVELEKSNVLLLGPTGQAIRSQLSCPALLNRIFCLYLNLVCTTLVEGRGDREPAVGAALAQALVSGRLLSSGFCRQEENASFGRALCGERPKKVLCVRSSV